MNRFLYAEANPATLIDPDGHCARYIDDFCADKGVSSSARVQHFRGTSANDRTTKRVPFTPKRSTQRAPAVRDNPRDDPWAPPTIASYNGLSNDDRNAYWMANGKNALTWLADHADTYGVLDNPSAYVIGRDYSFGLDRAYGTLEAARAGHPGEISVNPNAGLDPNLYMTGATEIAWAQSDHANVDSLFAFGPVGMAYAGVSDAGGGLGSGEREVTGAGPSNFADREIGGGGSLGSGQPQRLLVEPAGAYPASEYRDTTWPRSSTFNRSTNVTASEFQRNLANDGWMGTSSRSGTSYTRDGNRYFVYPVAKSTRGPAAAYTPAGFSSETLKIRLGGL